MSNTIERNAGFFLILNIFSKIHSNLKGKENNCCSFENVYNRTLKYKNEFSVLSNIILTEEKTGKRSEIVWALVVMVWVFFKPMIH